VVVLTLMLVYWTIVVRCCDKTHNYLEMPAAEKAAKAAQAIQNTWQIRLITLQDNKS